MAIKKKKTTKSAKRVSRIAPQKKSKAVKLDPGVSFVIKLLCAVAVLVYMFLSVYTDLAGICGSFFKWLLLALFGEGAYYVPLITLYVVIMGCIHIKTGEGFGKMITALVLMPVVSMTVHVLCNLQVSSLALGNWGNITAEAQIGLNGGLAGTYLGTLVRSLLGEWGAYIFVVLATLFCLFIMFNEIVGVAFSKLFAWMSKQFRQEKTSKVFRVPGVKADKVRSEEVIQKEIEKNTLDVPIAMDIPETTDVIIEKFASAEDQMKDPEIISEPIVSAEANKKPALTNQEIETVAQELNEAKEQQEKEYIYPSLDFLNKGTNRPTGLTKEELNENAVRLVTTMREFGVEAEVVSVQEGPSVTRYEIRPQVGVKISKIMGLSDDIALRMAAKGIRIAPVPGKTVIGVEIANQKVMPVFVRDVIASAEFMEHKSKVSFAVGKDIAGTTVVGDIAKMQNVALSLLII